jgi:hypothetical protein
MNQLIGAVRSTVKSLDHHLTPRFHDYNDNLNKTTQDKIVDVAACTFVLLAGVVSFLAFPQLTLAGFALGHVFRHTIRREIAGLCNTFLKVNLVAKAILGVAAFASWPYLYLAVPPLVGCYISWQANDRSANDNSFFSPPNARANFAGETSERRPQAV